MNQQQQGEALVPGSPPRPIPFHVVDPHLGVSLETLLQEKKRIGIIYYYRFNHHCEIKKLPLHGTPEELATAVIALRKGVRGRMLRELVEQTNRFIFNRIKDDPKKLIYLQHRWWEELHRRADELLADRENGGPTRLEYFAPMRNTRHTKKFSLNINPKQLDSSGRTLLELFSQKPEFGSIAIAKWNLDLANHPTIHQFFTICIQFGWKQLAAAIVYVARAQGGLKSGDQIKFRDQVTEELASMMNFPSLHGMVLNEWTNALSRNRHSILKANGEDYVDPVVAEKERLIRKLKTRISSEAKTKNWDKTYRDQLIRQGCETISSRFNVTHHRTGPEHKEEENKESEHDLTHAVLNFYQGIASQDADWYMDSSSQATESVPESHASPPQTPVYTLGLYEGPPGFEQSRKPNAFYRQPDHFKYDNYSPYSDQHHHMEHPSTEHQTHQPSPLPNHPFDQHVGAGNPQGGYHTGYQTGNVVNYQHQGTASASMPMHDMPGEQFTEGPKYYQNIPSDDFMNALWADPTTYYHTNSNAPPAYHTRNELDGFGGGGGGGYFGGPM